MNIINSLLHLSALLESLYELCLLTLEERNEELDMTLGC
jgi:hypothetical protein